MKTLPFFRRTAILLFAGMLFSGHAAWAQPDGARLNPERTMQKQAAVTLAVEEFYSALNTLFTGDAQPMKHLWSHADDITFMGPEGAYLRGWEEIGAMWDKVGEARLGGMVTPRDVHTVTGSELPLVTCIESGENVSDGKIETVRIRSSTLFRLEDGNWKAVHHQTDLLGFMGK
tara:strand:- start:319 stop:840 length:522 start_codon:yes stop_codon:yes gene_type:complete